VETLDYLLEELPRVYASVGAELSAIDELETQAAEAVVLEGLFPTGDGRTTYAIQMALLGDIRTYTVTVSFKDEPSAAIKDEVLAIFNSVTPN